MKEEEYQPNNFVSEITLGMRDLEERQRIAKERILLIGKNLIEVKMKTEEELKEVSQSINSIKKDLQKIKEILEDVVIEVNNSARKEELAILSRQVKMFNPLNFARIKDVEKIVEKKMKKIKSRK